MLDLRSGTSVVVAGSARTPIGKFGGGLMPLTAVQLGIVAVREALERAGIAPEEVDEVYFGHGRQAGCGPNPARQVSIGAGIPQTSPATTLNQACASGLKGILLAGQSIAVGAADVVLVGGMESMSNTPYLLPSARWGGRLGHTEILDGQFKDGFHCPLADELMGATAERLADQYGIGREAQDAYAVRSQQRAAAAWDAGRFDEEVVAVEVPGKKGPTLVERDEHLRPGSTIEGMAKLRPSFRKDGTVHPGNSSGITDGASAMVMMSRSAADRLGVEPQARVLAATQSGVDPRVMGIGPVPAIRELLDGTDLDIDDLDLVELNEAFAAQVLAVDREIGFDHDRLNVNGGAIALGHPIGCTGARIVTTLLYELARRQGRLGMATLCVSGGMGTAILFEREVG
jgi:acetyl-CoA C-acetyltransferase